MTLQDSGWGSWTVEASLDGRLSRTVPEPRVYVTSSRETDTGMGLRMVFATGDQVAWATKSRKAAAGVALDVDLGTHGGEPERL